ncbi:hypothetical protein [Plantactinospora endophytica]|nr:hypothetical protein [Plantactinospora endophytica]
MPEAVIFSLLGQNMAGKTSMVQIVPTLVPTNAGQVPHLRPRRAP